MTAASQPTNNASTDMAGIDEADVLAKIDRAVAISKRGQPLLLLGLLAIIGGFLILSLYLNEARRDARQEANEATRRANVTANTLEATKTALQAGDRDTAFKLLGIAIRQQEEAAENALAQISDRGEIRVAPAPPKQPQVESVLATAKTSEPSYSLPSYPAGANYKVFIQFAGKITRSQIVQLNQALRAAGWATQSASGERIATAATLNEVRYASESDQSAAQALAAALTQAAVGGRSVTAKQNRVIRPGTLEVWISN